MKEVGKDEKYLSSLYLHQCGGSCNTANGRWRAVHNINSVNFVIFNTGFYAIKEILRGGGEGFGDFLDGEKSSETIHVLQKQYWFHSGVA